MREILLVAVGGSAGAVSRWAVGNLVHRFVGPAFPWGTLTVNVVGSLAMGLLLGLSLEAQVVPPAVRLALGAGFLGAFTTFSTFSTDTLRLLESGSPGLAIVNVLASVLLSLLACWGGLVLARLF